MNSFDAKVKADRAKSAGCKGGNCRMCSVTYCDAVAICSIDAIKSVRSSSPAGAINRMDGERMALSSMFKGIGFDIPSDKICERSPVKVTKIGVLLLDEYYQSYRRN